MPLGLIFLIVIFIDAFLGMTKVSLLPDLNPKILYLKLQSVSLPLCRHLCLKPAIAVICGIIIFTWVMLRHDSSAFVLRRMGGC